MLMKMQGCKIQHEKLIEKNQQMKEKLDLLNNQIHKINNEHQQLTIKFVNLQSSLQYMSNFEQEIFTKEIALLQNTNFKNLEQIFNYYHQKVNLCNIIQAQNKVLKQKIFNIESNSEKQISTQFEQIEHYKQKKQCNCHCEKQIIEKVQNSSEMLNTNESLGQVPIEFDKINIKNKNQFQQHEQLKPLQIIFQQERKKHQQLNKKIFNYQKNIIQLNNTILQLKQTLCKTQKKNQLITLVLTQKETEIITNLSKSKEQLQTIINEIIGQKQNQKSQFQLLQSKEKIFNKLKNNFIELDKKIYGLDQQIVLLRFQLSKKQQKILQAQHKISQISEQKNKIFQQNKQLIQQKDLIFHAHNQTITNMSLNLQKQQINKKDYQKTIRQLQIKIKELSLMSKQNQKLKEEIKSTTVIQLDLLQKQKQLQNLLKIKSEQMYKKDAQIIQKNQLINKIMQNEEQQKSKIKLKQNQLTNKEQLLAKQIDQGCNRVRRVQCELNQERIKNESMNRKINILQSKSEQSKFSLDKMYEQMIIKDKKINYMEIKLKEYKSMIQMLRKQKEDIEKTCQNKIQAQISKHQLLGFPRKEHCLTQQEQQNQYGQITLKNQIVSMKGHFEIIKQQNSKLINILQQKEQDIIQKNQTIKMLQNKRDQILKQFQKISSKDPTTSLKTIQFIHKNVQQEVGLKNRKMSAENANMINQKQVNQKSYQNQFSKQRESKIASKAFKGFEILQRMLHATYRNYISIFTKEFSQEQLKLIESELNTSIKKCSDMQDIFVDYIV